MKSTALLMLGALLGGCASHHSVDERPSVSAESTMLEDAIDMAFAELCERAAACYPPDEASRCVVPISEGETTELEPRPALGGCPLEVRMAHPDEYERVLGCEYETLRDAEMALRSGCPAALPALAPGQAPCLAAVAEDLETLEYLEIICYNGLSESDS